MGTGEGPPDRNGGIGKARYEINEAMDTMRNNMTIMAEREAKLSELNDKSSTLQSTSNAFSRQARVLQWEMRWQQLRIRLLMIFLSIDAIVFLTVGYKYGMKHKTTWTVGLCCQVALFILFLIERFLSRRWRAQVEAAATTASFVPLE
mmetsp:Transcript_3718/g.9483  ORF Transcript_3718/g.9483 Transcript_3718/m.9483 type:complete len:148 (-) Transcript_3718:139-582(-)